METPSSDPPAYTPTMAAAPTSVRRSLEDIRLLILANANVIRPPGKGEGAIELIMGKARDHTPLPSGRLYRSSNSNVTLRLPVEADEEGATTASTTPPDLGNDGGLDGGSGSTMATQQGSATRAQGRHYAALVSRPPGAVCIDVVMLGEPQDSVEEALEWLLDRTEIVITEMLSRHRRPARPRCCAACANTTLGARR